MREAHSKAGKLRRASAKTALTYCTHVDSTSRVRRAGPAVSEAGVERPSGGRSVGRRISTRRRIAVASWRPPSDGRIYTRTALDATEVLAYVEAERRRTGVHVTVTHVVGAALARALMAVPEVQARIVFGRLKALESCDIGFAVDVQDGTDLAPVKVRQVDQLTPLEVARKLAPGAARVRAGMDPSHARSSSIVSHVPWWALRPLLNTASLLVGGLGVPAFGQPAFPLGVAFVSNVGTLGLDEAFMAPLPLARTPIYLAIGAVREAPMVLAGSVVVRPQIVLVATGDHRIVDGAQAGRIVCVLRELLAEPSRLDSPWRAT